MFVVFQLGQNTKKLWDDDKGGGGDSGKVMFAGGPWMAREADGWPTQAADHILSHPINVSQRRPGSFPGSDPSSVLSPRSSETGALGVNMAEYVLGGSPVGKEMDVRLHGMKRFVSSALRGAVACNVQHVVQIQPSNILVWG